MATMLVEPFAPWLRELSQALQTPGIAGAFALQPTCWSAMIA